MLHLLRSSDHLIHSIHQFGWVSRLTETRLQNYAIVEFGVPYMALRAKRALDDVEAAMRPDTSRRAEREAGGRVEQVKLLRSEFAAIKSLQSQFSRTLFVSNLPPVRAPHFCLTPSSIFLL